MKFEYVETMYWLINKPTRKVFVTVMDKFVHHYSGVKMYHIRVERIEKGIISDYIYTTEYKTVEQKELDDMLRTRISRSSKGEKKHGKE